MKNSKPLTRLAFILDMLCLLLCLALLYLGNTNRLPYWALATGAMIALVALVASLYLFIKARKIDSAESRRIKQEILENAAKEESDVAPETDDKVAVEDKEDAAVEELEDYKTDDE